MERFLCSGVCDLEAEIRLATTALSISACGVCGLVYADRSRDIVMNALINALTLCSVVSTLPPGYVAYVKKNATNAPPRD